MKAQKDNFKRLSATDAGRGLGISQPTLRRWVDQGMPKGKDGSYNLPACVRWRLEFVAEKVRESTARPEGDSSELDKLRAEKMKRDISLKDFDLKEKLSESIPRSELIEVLTHRASTWSQLIAQVPRFAPEFVNLPTLEAAREKLLTLCRKINAAFVEYNGVRSEQSSTSTKNQPEGGRK